MTQNRIYATTPCAYNDYSVQTSDIKSIICPPIAVSDILFIENFVHEIDIVLVCNPPPVKKSCENRLLT